MEAGTPSPFSFPRISERNCKANGAPDKSFTRTSNAPLRGYKGDVLDGVFASLRAYDGLNIVPYLAGEQVKSAPGSQFVSYHRQDAQPGPNIILALVRFRARWTARILKYNLGRTQRSSQTGPRKR